MPAPQLPRANPLFFRLLNKKQTLDKAKNRLCFPKSRLYFSAHAESAGREHIDLNDVVTNVNQRFARDKKPLGSAKPSTLVESTSAPLHRQRVQVESALALPRAPSILPSKMESCPFKRKKRLHNQILQFLKSSSHFGRKSRHLDFAFPWHASMCNKFLGVRNKVAHINAQQTFQSLVEAFYSIAVVLRKGGKVLVINKNSEFSSLFYPNNLDAGVLQAKRTPCFASNNKQRFALERQGPATAPLKWVGGCLTNWKEISKSVATLLYFSKRFGGFINQNNIHFPRFKKMKNSFQGFINIEKEQLLLKERPQLLFLFDAYESQQILDEAIGLQIPVVALTDSSTDLSQITYPIPINSDSAHLVYWCFSQLIQIIERQERFF